jgi:hypothetical protein
MLFLYVYIIDHETPHSRPITGAELYKVTHRNKENVPVVVSYALTAVLCGFFLVFPVFVSLNLNNIQISTIFYFNFIF